MALTAYKVWIKDLVVNECKKEEGEFGSTYVEINGKKVSRVNILTPVIDVYNTDGYSSITLNDGSENIRAKAWKEDIRFFENVKIGDIVLLIGKIKEWKGEKYLAPEVLRQMNEQWAFVRKLELAKLYGKKEIPIPNVVDEYIQEDTQKNKGYEEERIVEESVVESSSTRQKIVLAIKDLDSENGAEVLKITNKLKLDDSEIKKVLNELLEEGEIYEPRSGCFKLTG